MNEAAAPRRIALLDVVRGIALVAMMVFHGAWDVSFLHLVRFDPGASAGWTIYARSIAIAFLVISGVSLVLANRDGVRRDRYLRRLVRIAAAAMLVSVATWFVLPQGWVFFGILHQIALATVLALPFLRLPPLPTLAVAAAVFLLPQFYRSDVFDTPALWWVGLAPVPPVSFDYVPLFPWFAAVLLGIAAARAALASGLDQRLARWRPRFFVGRALDWGGRHSLAVYLVHQPILYGLFFLIAHFALPDTAVNAARADCADRCVMVGNTESDCRAYCACVFDDAGKAGLVPALLDNSLTAAQTDTLRGMAGVCSARTIPKPPAVSLPDGPPGDAPASEENQP